MTPSMARPRRSTKWHSRSNVPCPEGEGGSQQPNAPLGGSLGMVNGNGFCDGFVMDHLGPVMLLTIFETWI